MSCDWMKGETGVYANKAAYIFSFMMAESRKTKLTSSFKTLITYYNNR